MIDQKEGETELNVIVHYDNMVSSGYEHHFNIAFSLN